jgi:hypothetical protein
MRHRCALNARNRASVPSTPLKLVLRQSTPPGRTEVTPPSHTLSSEWVLFGHGCTPHCEALTVECEGTP